MQRLPAVLLALSFIASQPAVAQSGAPTTQLPAGTRIPLAVTRPVWSSSVKPGDPIYAQTTFPATVDDHLAIPSGTYVEGQIDSLTKPTRKVNHATFAIHFTKIIFANGYTVLLPSSEATSDSSDHATLDIQASPANDLLLDNGAQIEMTLGSPLTLNSAQVAAAIPVSKPLEPGAFKSATLCRPTPGYPGSPGSPDTVIPQPGYAVDHHRRSQRLPRHHHSRNSSDPRNRHPRLAQNARYSRNLLSRAASRAFEQRSFPNPSQTQLESEPTCAPVSLPHF